jgi:hypothetical protein
MKKNSFIKVWISPRDVCLLAAIGNGRPPLECAQSGNGPEDHILAGLHREQIQTLWNLGGCRDERTGGPLLGPDGRLVCAFETIKLERGFGPKGPREQQDYDLLSEKYDKESNSTKKAEIARKMVSLHDNLGRHIIYFDSVIKCMNDKQTELQEIRKTNFEKAQKLEKTIMKNISDNKIVDLNDYRNQIETISSNMFHEMVIKLATISKCFNTHFKKELKYYHKKTTLSKEPSTYNRILNLKTMYGKTDQSGSGETVGHGLRETRETYNPISDLKPMYLKTEQSGSEETDSLTGGGCVVQ